VSATGSLAAGERWWVPRPVVPAARRSRPLPWAHRRAAQRAIQAHSAGLARLQAALDGAPSLDAASISGLLATARRALRRAQARDDAVLLAEARLQALLACAQAVARNSGAQPSVTVLEAALALGSGAACVLPARAPRLEALGLAAAVAALGGRPVYMLALDDGTANATAEALRPWFAACGLHNACIGAQVEGAALPAAYRADVVHVAARRLAADLSRDRRLRNGAGGDALDALNGLGGQIGQIGLDGRDAPLQRTLTRGLHSVFIDDLDRVLFDDALQPVVLTIAEDAAALRPAVAAACQAVQALQAPMHYRIADDGRIDFSEAGLALLPQLAAQLPPLWRTGLRSEALVVQALLARDHLQAGRDYTMAPNGTPLFDERITLRVPERGLLTGLAQALQARQGLPLAPLTRTVERTSLQALCAGAHRLAGAAPCLHGLEAELWADWRLPLRVFDEGAAGAADIRTCVVTAVALAAAAGPSGATLADAHPEAGAAPVPLQRISVRRGAAPAGARSADDPATILVTEGTLAQPQALHAMARMVLPAIPLELQFAEALDSVRAEVAALRRASDGLSVPLLCTRLLAADDRLLHDHLGPAAELLSMLAALWPAAAGALLPWALAAARRRTARSARLQRRQLARRESELREQLSFADQRGAAGNAPAAG